MFDVRDHTLFSTCPVIFAPRYSPLPPPQIGQRVVVARNGVFLHTLLPWLECLHRIGAINYPALPYGVIRPFMRFAFGTLPPALIRDFVDLARERAPNECAASLVYGCGTGTLDLRECVPLDCSTFHIDYHQAPLAADEIVAVDLHSHGEAPAFFSEQDDEDDQGIKIAVVIGSVHRPVPDCVCRLVINGHYITLSPPWPPASGDSLRATDH